MAVTLTEKAATHVNAMLSQRGHGIGLRLGTKVSGCTGYAYTVDYVDELNTSDSVFECHGVKVIVNQQSLSHLEGMEVDYVRQNGLNSGFEFRNPNIKDMCGCGESFNLGGK